MIVRQFLLWARYAPPGQRAEAVGALARAYLAGDLAAEDAFEAETALTAMLDDPAGLVRRALAEALAGDPAAPRHIVLALAVDQCDVAALVLARSPLLHDSDLVDCAALGDAVIQSAIASRPALSVAVAAALAEIGDATALVILARNEGADISDASLARIVERHGDHAGLREALLTRRDLPVDVAQSIAAAIAASLTAVAQGCGWLSSERTERIIREACDRATIALSSGADGEDCRRLVAHLRRSGQLTPTLILRALLCGGRGFVVAAFADLTGHPERRVAATLNDRRGQGFRALYDRSGLPASLRPAFAAALSSSGGLASGHAGAGEARLSRRLIGEALAACEALPGREGDRLTSLLRRFDLEAARETAREAADAMADDAALRLLLEHAPETLMIEDGGALAA